MKKLFILFSLMSLMAIGQDMHYQGEVQQIDGTIPNGDTSVIVAYADTCAVVPLIRVMDANAEVRVTSITKQSCKVSSSDNNGRSFRVAVCKPQ